MDIRGVFPVLEKINLTEFDQVLQQACKIYAEVFETEYLPRQLHRASALAFWNNEGARGNAINGFRREMVSAEFDEHPEKRRQLASLVEKLRTARMEK
jgi:hypothetical protein